jgi:hypothetical protein
MKMLLITLLCFGLTYTSYTQDWSGKQYQFDEVYPGYIITLKGDTATGYILHGGRAFNQNRAVFYPDASRKNKKEFKPSELKGYGVADKHYRSVHFSGGLLAKPLSFVLVSQPGRITQFIFYSKKGDNLVNVRSPQESLADFDARIHNDEIVWQKGDETPVQQADFVMGFAKKMSKLVAEDTELAKKVSDKEKGYGLGNIYNIISEYNKWWDANNIKN